MSMRGTLNVTASFVIGAAAVFALDAAMRRWRAGGAAGRERRLRSQVAGRIAQLVSHPDAIRFQLEGGLLRVSGHVLANELDRLLSELTQVHGVHRVHNAVSPVQDASRLEELSRGARTDDGAEGSSSAYRASSANA
jgi:hypothetical protein